MNGRYTCNEVIPPLAVASKLALARQNPGEPFAQQLRSVPRLRELMWAIQWQSAQPGGLDALVEAVMNFDDVDFRPLSMPAVPSSHGKPRIFDLPLWLRIMADLPERERPELKLDPWHLNEQVKHHLAELKPDALKPREAAAITGSFDSYMFKDLCWQKWGQAGAGLLRRLCTEPAIIITEAAEIKSGRPVANWFCPQLIDVLLAYFDRHAAATLAQIAPTAVTTKVFDALDYVLATNGFSEIKGSSRFGKSESGKVWCMAWPGKGRFFTVPPAGNHRVFLWQLADAFFHPYAAGTPVEQLESDLIFILNNSGCLIVADEAHFLLPPRYTKKTQPERLNFYRCQIVDRGVPTAILVTPQPHDHAVKRFTEKTGFPMEQWLGRSTWPVKLPETLSSADVLAVVRHHLPGCDQSTAEAIASRAINSAAFLKSVSNVAQRALYLAKADGASKPTRVHIHTALDELLPSATKVSLLRPASAPGKVKAGESTAETPRVMREHLAQPLSDDTDPLPAPRFRVPEAGALVT